MRVAARGARIAATRSAGEPWPAPLAVIGQIKRGVSSTVARELVVSGRPSDGRSGHATPGGDGRGGDTYRTAA